MVGYQIVLVVVGLLEPGLLCAKFVRCSVLTSSFSREFRVVVVQLSLLSFHLLGGLAPRRPWVGRVEQT